MLGEVLTRVDFDLEPHRPRRLVFRLKSIEEIDATLFEDSAWFTQPGVNRGTNSVKCDPDWTGRNLHEVDVFRVSSGGSKVQFV